MKVLLWILKVMRLLMFSVIELSSLYLQLRKKINGCEIKDVCCKHAYQLRKIAVTFSQVRHEPHRPQGLPDRKL